MEANKNLQEKSNQKEQPKRPYQSPHLDRRGTVKEVTKGKLIGFGDGEGRSK